MTSMLNNNTLTRDNYIDWNCNLYIVLASKGNKYVNEEECPMFPKMNGEQSGKGLLRQKGEF